MHHTFLQLNCLTPFISVCHSSQSSLCSVHVSAKACKLLIHVSSLHPALNRLHHIGFTTSRFPGSLLELTAGCWIQSWRSLSALNAHRPSLHFVWIPWPGLWGLSQWWSGGGNNSHHGRNPELNKNLQNPPTKVLNPETCYVVSEQQHLLWLSQNIYLKFTQPCMETTNPVGSWLKCSLGTIIKHNKIC